MFELFESLESRQLLAFDSMFALDPISYPPGAIDVAPVSVEGDTLTVRGTPAGDRITIGPADSRQYEVVINSIRYTGSSSGISRVAVYAGAGNDNVSISAVVGAAATLYGDGGNDTLSGGNGWDALYGGYGFDRLLGNGGFDQLHGGHDNDWLYGGKHSDSLHGDEGNDVLYGGTWDDRFEGGPGLDTVSYNESERTRGVRIAFGAPGFSGHIDERDTILNDVESAEGSPFDDLIYGTSASNTLRGHGGKDTIYGFNGNDLIHGGAGDDRLDGGAHHDRIFAQDGNDYALGGSGNDNVLGGNGNDSLHGGIGDDSVHGERGDDMVWGHAGDDLITGGDDADSLYGGAGADGMDGGSADDVLVAVGGGRDTLAGRTGNDSFWCDPSAEDTIRDADIAELSGGYVHRIEAFRNARSYDGATDTYTFGKEPDGGDVLDPRLPSGLTYRNFGANPLFAPGGPSKNDIVQGAVGDCWFAGTLSAIAKTSPGRIRNAVVSLGDGSYAVRFHRGGEQYFRVDADLAIGSDGSLTYARLGTGRSIWVAIVEKTFVFARAAANVNWVPDFAESTRLASIYRPFYGAISAGWPTEAFSWFGMGGTTSRDAGDFDDIHELGSWIQGQLAAGRPLLFCTPPDPGDWDLVGPHCYLVDGIQDTPSGKFLILRNPWGTDGTRFSAQGPDDGYLAIHIADALDHVAALQSAAP